MAYIFRSAIDVSQNLQFDLEGGDESKTVDLIKDGRSIMGGLKVCLMVSLPVPDELLSAVPTRIIVTPNRNGFIPDFGFDARLGGCFIVSSRFVGLVERLEPNVHQFLKIPSAATADGQELKRDFYLMNVLVRLAAVDVDNSTVEWVAIQGGSKLLQFRPGPKRDQKLVLRRSIIAKHHIWKGAIEQFPTWHFCSDQLFQEMTAGRLSDLSLERVEEM